MSPETPTTSSTPNTPSDPLRVCYFGTYRAGYTRNQILIKGLRRAGVEVYECHETLWQSIEDRVAVASGGWRRLSFLGRVARAYWQLFWRHRRIPVYDVMLIGYPGQFDAYLGRLLAWWRKVPLVLDILMSLYLVAEERGLTTRAPFTARLLFWLEKGGLRLPDLLIAENGAYERYYRERYGIPADRFVRLPHGADEAVYTPRPTAWKGDDLFRVTYHGGFLPSHGVDAILDAAGILRDHSDIIFDFYGTGPEAERIRVRARHEELQNVVFHGFVSQEALLDALGRAAICCGVFGETRQSHFTIQNKVYEGLAMGRAVVSGDSAVVREVLRPGEEIVLVPRADGAALAAEILALKKDPERREAVAHQGLMAYQAGHTTRAIGERLAKILAAVAERQEAGSGRV